MELLIVNGIGAVTGATHEGRAYLVADATIIVPGVLPGSKGPLFYPADEVRNSARLWDGVRITLNHPQDPTTGQHLSAHSPGVWERSGLGFLRNSTFKDTLRTKMWFDVARTEKVDSALPVHNRILPKLRHGKPIELSTGLFTRNDPAPLGAVFNGRPYTHVARAYRPDHLAVLPDQKGACSLNDGCGVLVNTQGRDKLGRFAAGDGVRVKTDATVKKDGQSIAHPRAGHAGTLVSHDKKDGTAVIRLDHDGGKQIRVKAEHVELHDSRPTGTAPLVGQHESQTDLHARFSGLKKSGARKDADEFLTAVISAKGTSYLHGLALDHGVDLSANPGKKGTDTATPGEISRRLLDKHFPTTNAVSDVFGVLVNQAHTFDWPDVFNSFCPTGKGGGVDPSCAANEATKKADASGKKEDHEAAAKAHRTAADEKRRKGANKEADKHELKWAGHSGAAKRGGGKRVGPVGPPTYNEFPDLFGVTRAG
jgi:ribosomal protein L21E